MEKEQVPHLRALNHGRDLDTIPVEREEKWGGRQVVIPKVVVHHLIVPNDLSRGASQRHQRIGVEVVARSPNAIVVRAGAAGRDEHQVVFFVRGERGPGVACSRRQLSSVLGIMGHPQKRLPRPKQGTSSYVEPTHHTARCISKPIIKDARSDDDHVPENRGRCSLLVLASTSLDSGDIRTKV